MAGGTAPVFELTVFEGGGLLEGVGDAVEAGPREAYLCAGGLDGEGGGFEGTDIKPAAEDALLPALVDGVALQPDPTAVEGEGAIVIIYIAGVAGGGIARDKAVVEREGVVDTVINATRSTFGTVTDKGAVFKRGAAIIANNGTTRYLKIIIKFYCMIIEEGAVAGGKSVIIMRRIDINGSCLISAVVGKEAAFGGEGTASF